MELRVLQYFLAVTREQSISGAAESLHLSQPTLSRQLKDMEDELGKQLFIRGNRRVTLTEEGMILRKRAEEIMELVKKAEDEISLSDETVAGDITIGAGETDGVRLLTKAAQKVQSEYPLVHFHIVSGDRTTVAEEMDKGLIDFGLLLGEIDTSKYEYIKLPYKDCFGVLMRRDSPLAAKETITPQDLLNQPLILSRQMVHDSDFHRLFHCDVEKLNIVATYNLLYNGSLMVDEGRQLIFLVPLLSILPGRMGVTGVWASCCTSDAVAFILALITVIITNRRIARRLNAMNLNDRKN